MPMKLFKAFLTICALCGLSNALLLRNICSRSKAFTKKDIHRRRSTTKMMFSGIVEDLGIVERLIINPSLPRWDGSVGEGVELTIISSVAVQDAYIGCSIAVNGVCLTATQHDDSKFTVNLAPETLRRTNLGSLNIGGRVNVERALRADGRNSGHFVQGHVDGMGRILDRWMEGDSLWVKVGLCEELLRYVVPKGFIAVDGTSLTVCDVQRSRDTRDERGVGQIATFVQSAGHSLVSDQPSTVSSEDLAANSDAGTGQARERTRGWFTIMLVSHTQQNVIFPSKDVGDLVNIEVDVLGKMVEQSLSGGLESLKNDMAMKDKELQELREFVVSQQAAIAAASDCIRELGQRLQNLEHRLQQ